MNYCCKANNLAKRNEFTEILSPDRCMLLAKRLFCTHNSISASVHVDLSNDLLFNSRSMYCYLTELQLQMKIFLYKFFFPLFLIIASVKNNMQHVTARRNSLNQTKWYSCNGGNIKIVDINSMCKAKDANFDEEQITELQIPMSGEDVAKYMYVFC